MRAEAGASPLGLMHAMARALALRLFPAHDPSFGRLLVFRTADIPVVDDDWAERIIELGDGRPVGEIVAAMYREELTKGGWMADIGLWRGAFARRVIGVITELAERGYVALRDAETA